MTNSCAFTIICIISLSFFIGCSSLKLDESIHAGEYDWLLGAGSSERSHFLQAVASPPFSADWEYNAGGGVASNALLAKGDFLFVTTLHGELHLIDILTGKRIGRQKFDEPISASAALHDDIIFIPLANGDNTLIAYDLVRGKEFWKKKLGPVEAAPLIHREILFAAARNGTLYAIDPKTGTEEWKYETGRMVYSSPAATESSVFVGTTAGIVYALNYQNGEVVWKSDTLRTIMSAPVVGGDYLYITSRDSLVYCFDTTTGEKVWTRNVGARIYSATAIGDEYLIVGTAAGDVIALIPETGEEQWRFSAKSVVNATPLIGGNFVYSVSLDNNVYVLDKRDGVLHWSFDVGSRLKTTPLLHGNRLILCAEDRRVYSFTQKISGHTM